MVCAFFSLPWIKPMTIKDIIPSVFGYAVIHSGYFSRGAENKHVLLINRKELFNIVRKVPLTHGQQPVET